MVSFNPEMKTSEMQALSQKLDMPCLFAMNSDRARAGVIRLVSIPAYQQKTTRLQGKSTTRLLFEPTT
jgi:hypothetical protein